ncbi:MAG TPA: TolC family protein, partial [Kofleriaceae bacterium]|nr:TolC family protein [Kofleriaceae bacterium]
GDAALAPPGDATPPEAALPEAALDDHPQRAAATAHVRAAEARSALAERAYFPDFEVMASYNSMWDTPEHRWMLGVAINLPIERGRRDAALAAAEARVAQARAQDDSVRDQLRVEAARTARELREGLRVVQLYDARLVPAARAQVDAAIAGFAAGQNDFAAVIGAERGLREIELAALRARADAWHRRAALDRALGHLPGGGAP